MRESHDEFDPRRPDKPCARTVPEDDTAAQRQRTMGGWCVGDDQVNAAGKPDPWFQTKDPPRHRRVTVLIDPVVIPGCAAETKNTQPLPDDKFAVDRISTLGR